MNNMSNDTLRVLLGIINEYSLDGHYSTNVEKAFTDDSWDSPESNLDAASFCKVCLINTNDGPSSTWTKSKCHLPIRKESGGVIYKAALRNAKARLNQVNASSEDKAKALSRLNSLMESAGMAVSKVTTQSIQSRIIKEAYTGVYVLLMIDNPSAVLQLQILCDQLPSTANTTTPKELHVTLAYFGDGDNQSVDEQTAMPIIKGVMESYGFIRGTVNGIAKFLPEDGGLTPIVALFDSPQLIELRQKLLDALLPLGICVDDTHGFTPHITLGYIDNPKLDNLYFTPFEFPIKTVKVNWAGRITECGLGNSNVGKNNEYNESVIKADEEQRTLTAIVYPAMPVGWNDTQGDWISEENIRTMAWEFMKKSQRYDLHHKVLDVSKDQAVVVESWIAPVDLQLPQSDGTTYSVTKGSWIVTTHFPDEAMWERVKKGEFGGYSIRGKGKRRPIGTVPTGM